MNRILSILKQILFIYVNLDSLESFGDYNFKMIDCVRMIIVNIFHFQHCDVHLIICFMFYICNH